MGSRRCRYVASSSHARRGPAVETAGHMEIARRFPQALGKPADGFPTVPHSPDDDGFVERRPYAACLRRIRCEPLLRRSLEPRLTTAVGMVEDRCSRPAATGRHLQGRQRQPTTQSRAHRPTDHPARTQIQQHSQIQPASPCRNIGDISRPDRIGSRDLELTRESIRGHWPPVFRVCRDPEPASKGAFQAVVTHQARHPVSAAAKATPAQLVVDPRAPIPATALAMNRPDLEQQTAILSATPALRTMVPGVVTTGRDLQDSTHHVQRKLPSVPANECEPHRWRSETMPSAFFRMSRSIVTRSRSRRRRHISSSRALR